LQPKSANVSPHPLHYCDVVAYHMDLEASTHKSANAHTGTVLLLMTLTF